jgi:hypothetical protein
VIVTVAKYLTPKHTEINGVGVPYDIKVDFRRPWYFGGGIMNPTKAIEVCPSPYREREREREREGGQGGEKERVCVSSPILPPSYCSAAFEHFFFPPDRSSLIDPVESILADWSGLVLLMESD